MVTIRHVTSRFRVLVSIVSRVLNGKDVYKNSVHENINSTDSTVIFFLSLLQAFAI